jgi:hypothetical protein
VSLGKQAIDDDSNQTGQMPAAGTVDWGPTLGNSVTKGASNLRMTGAADLQTVESARDAWYLYRLNRIRSKPSGRT